jgi:hypothetical protein
MHLIETKCKTPSTLRKLKGAQENGEQLDVDKS